VPIANLRFSNATTTCPSRDYIVVKELVHSRDGRHLSSETEAEYEKTPSRLGWLPKKWMTTAWSANGSVFRRDEHFLIASTSTESDVPEELFHFDYPDGTEILDWSDQHENKYAIVWNGRRIPVDLGRHYNDLLETAKKKSGDGNPRNRSAARRQ
jgi:hypothetical protein